jgi:oligoendopeptidase F
LFNQLPVPAEDFMGWTWEQIEPFYLDLIERPLTGDNLETWLSDWTKIAELVSEMYARLNVAVTINTEDPESERQFNRYLDQIHPKVQAADQRLKEKLLDSGMEPSGMETPLRKMRAEAAIFRGENLPLLSEERKMASEYNKIIGAQTISWEGEELTLQQLRRVFQTTDRSIRQRAWRLASERQLADQQKINELWVRMLNLRLQLARNADLPDYRAYRWQQMLRLDYTPQDCILFQQAIEQVVVPAASRRYEKHRQRLGVDTLRPWDLDQDLYPLDLPPLPSYGATDELPAKAEAVFARVDPHMGQQFHTLREQNLLDLDNRKGKAPGAYCTAFPVARQPFIFTNAVGLSSDVRTILHESGHAFHNFERFNLPYFQQRLPGLEFAEVASMAMELLASPYLADGPQAFYSPANARRFRLQLLEHILFFWPYMAVVDAFQHWVYTHPDLSQKPAFCNAKWFELWARFLPGVDWSGLELQAMTSWQRKQHIHRYPFYYVEYGMAQLGAVQIWANALHDPQDALERYRQALRLGGTASLPQLYQAAGARFVFNLTTLAEAVQLIERSIVQLEQES